mgnify:FL=1
MSIEELRKDYEEEFGLYHLEYKYTPDYFKDRFWSTCRDVLEYLTKEARSLNEDYEINHIRLFFVLEFIYFCAGVKEWPTPEIVIDKLSRMSFTL